MTQHYTPQQIINAAKLVSDLTEAGWPLGDAAIGVVGSDGGPSAKVRLPRHETQHSLSPWAYVIVNVIWSNRDQVKGFIITYYDSGNLTFYSGELPDELQGENVAYGTFQSHRAALAAI